MSDSVPSHYTPGEISRLLRQPISRVNYVIESRRIQPVARVGVIRLFTEEARRLIAAELADIDARRSQVVASS